MKLLNGLKQTAILPNRVVATIGNFDGVHRGHQALLVSLRMQAARLQCPVLVILFEPQPAEYFQPQQAPARLTRLRKKLQALQSLGVDYVCCLKFNTELAQMSASDFAEDILFKSLNVTYLLTGDDFRFGRNRAGDLELLAAIGKKHNAIVESFPNFQVNDKRISSTGIRLALQQGNLQYAASCLGRPYSLCGRVIQGDGRGRQWGIPTANIALQHDRLPLSGVFAVHVQRRHDKTLYRGVANIGRRPTIEGQLQLTFEVHLFDFDDSIYGEMLDVTFVHHLRNEEKFNSVEALINQIHQDIVLAKRLFSSETTIIEYANDRI